MARIRHSSEQIIGKLREAKVLLGQGQSVADVCKRLEVTEQTYYRWRKEYGGMKTEQARRLKELEKENARLKPSSCKFSLGDWLLRMGHK